MNSKADIIVSVCYQLPTQDNVNQELFFGQLGEILGSFILVLMEYFNLTSINWKYHTAVSCKSEKFLKYVEDNFLSQVLSVTTRKGVICLRIGKAFWEK